MAGIDVFGAVLIALCVSIVCGVIAQDLYDEWMYLKYADDEDDEDYGDDDDYLVFIDLERGLEFGDMCWDDSRGCECLFLGEFLGKDNDVYAMVSIAYDGVVEVGRALPSALHYVSRYETEL